MSPGAAKSKRRSYDGSGRKERARHQRQTTLDHARELFLEHGYAATTVESIATAAGVSAATIYKTYGGKTGLVRELCAQALAGEGPRPAEERSDALRRLDDARAVVAGWGALVSEVAPRVSPLLIVLRTAAEVDPDAAVLRDELEDDRLDRMADNARYLFDSGQLREDVTFDEVRDVLWLCSSPELYELLVLRRRWTAARFGAFVADLMAGTLL
jgi:AcrR family transcriptional regulator